MKIKMCEKYNIFSKVVKLPKNTLENEVIKTVEDFNNDNKIHGILIQLPLPNHINQDNVLNTVDVNKDVDGFNVLLTDVSRC